MSNRQEKYTQAAVHQLERAVEQIRNGNGIVADWNYNEETDDYYPEMGAGVTGEVDSERTVTLEVTFLLPE